MKCTHSTEEDLAKSDLRADEQLHAIVMGLINNVMGAVHDLCHSGRALSRDQPVLVRASRLVCRFV